jgi:hypothetical protein
MIVYFFRVLFELISFRRLGRLLPRTATTQDRPVALVRRTYRVVKAVKEFQRDHGSECAWCGAQSSVEVHHIVPIWMDAELAHEKSNLFPLCRRCHLVLGHAGSFRDRYIENVKQICEMKNLMDRRILIQTNKER